MQTGDTIVAISSAMGGAGCGASRIIVRISGPDALRLTHVLLHPDEVEAPLEASTASIRDLRFRNLPAVPSWIYTFKSPRSATGEDVIELHLSGNALLARLALDDLVERGARPAEPGEFTARAFFNGRINLAEAEAVAALISASSQAQLDAARRLLGGELARRLAPSLESITQTLALLEAGIDFVDEDVTFLPENDFVMRVRATIESLESMLAETSRFERFSHEPHVVLAGRPNAGKSTLLNVMAEHERAIVSPLAGTTRDALIAIVRLPRGFVRMIDIAGVDARCDSDIDRAMQSSAQRSIETADVLVMVHDCADDRPPLELSRCPEIVVRSKSDLADAPVGRGALAISALSGYGLDVLRRRMDELCFGESAHAAQATLALSARHVREIEVALESLRRALTAIQQGAEVAAFELREALDALGSILGHVTTDDVLGRVFSAFCIGK